VASSTVRAGDGVSPLARGALADRLPAKLPEMGRAKMGRGQGREVCDTSSYADQGWSAQIGWATRRPEWASTRTYQLRFLWLERPPHWVCPQLPFVLCDRAVEGLNVSDFSQVSADLTYGVPGSRPFAQAVVGHSESCKNRHLGMIEALKGVLGERYSTRSRLLDLEHGSYRKASPEEHRAPYLVRLLPVAFSCNRAARRSRCGPQWAHGKSREVKPAALWIRASSGRAGAFAASCSRKNPGVVVIES